MGIRIHKAIGYGAIIPNIDEIMECLDENSIDGEVNQLIVDAIAKEENNRNNLFLETQKMADTHGWKYPKYFYECILYTEYPDRKGGHTLIVPPMYVDKWRRYDDIIDYYNADLTDCDTKIKIINKPIYPYIDYMDPVTFEHISENDEYLMRYDDEIKIKPVPGIPASVRVISDKIGIDWKTLKPMAATWWS